MVACGESDVFAHGLVIKLATRAIKRLFLWTIPDDKLDLRLKVFNSLTKPGDRAGFGRLETALEAEYLDATGTMDGAVDEGRASKGTVAKAEAGGKPKGKRGPKGPRYDAKEDRRVFDGWKASRYETIEEYTRKEQGAHTREEIRGIRLAIDRERKQRKRKGLS